jgi:hypothetical protein
MLGKLNAKVALTSAVLAAAALPCSSQISFAASATGKITVYHLNGDVQGRGACIQMTPAIPGTWACVWLDHLYNEKNQLLREGYFSGKQCTVNWDTDLGGLHLINIAQCE